MEQDNRSFIHDTIDLDEIRMLLGRETDAADGAEIPDIPDLPEEKLQDEQADSASGAETSHEESETPDMIEEDSFDLAAFLRENNDLADASEPEIVPVEAEIDAVEADGVSDDTVEASSGDESVKTPAESAASAVEEEVKTPERKKNSAAVELYNMLHDVIYLLAAVTLIFVFVVRLVGVKGDSMLPTLHNRDFLLLESNFLYGGEDLQYGDVVVLNVPSYEMQGEGPIVKRVIATEGQEVNIDFEAGVVYVDGVLLHETYINTPTNYNWDGEYDLQYPAIVPENCIFVLGDNRNNSMDSRYAPIGMVDERCVLGKVLLIVLPGQTVDNAGNVIDPRDWGRIGLVS